ncbi:hypothetical protein ACIQVU_07945 [Lysinibacillus sp. NPDC098008]|uniref:hypothetical protein n=1 Tax=Lysinibacillus sp. NPDC098008 TaxID=3364146 RepID=UPI00380E0259
MNTYIVRLFNKSSDTVLGMKFEEGMAETTDKELVERFKRYGYSVEIKTPAKRKRGVAK